MRDSASSKLTWNSFRGENAVSLPLGLAVWLISKRKFQECNLQSWVSVDGTSLMCYATVTGLGIGVWFRLIWNKNSLVLIENGIQTKQSNLSELLDLVTPWLTSVSEGWLDPQLAPKVFQLVRSESLVGRTWAWLSSEATLTVSRLANLCVSKVKWIPHWARAALPFMLWHMNLGWKLRARFVVRAWQQT